MCATMQEDVTQCHAAAVLSRYNYLLSVYLCGRHRLVSRHGLKQTDFLPLPRAAESLLLSAAATSGACAATGTVPDRYVRCAGQPRGLKGQSAWDLIVCRTLA